ncbi:hypothetical protein D1BOALGB6SA_4457 [Olavius sp. associated proteobacterium Delta 1]|nr:hypothetical protein D1BOALGB6SA_4457 [Olavius sp. associated proteobacterium Delta 1]
MFEGLNLANPAKITYPIMSTRQRWCFMRLSCQPDPFKTNGLKASSSFATLVCLLQ